MMQLIPLFLIGIGGVLLLVLTLLKRKAPANLRVISALTRLYRMLGLTIEEGSRLHILLGRGGLMDARGGSALAGLAMLRHIAERTSVSDKPAIASSGDPTIGLLTQDTIQSGYHAAGVDELYVPTSGRVAGLTSFSYAAGTMHVTQNENVSANVMIGHFGVEAGLLTDASDRANVTVIGASDDLAGQAVLFASTQDALIGEELFAAGAYLGAGVSHRASLSLQDLLRWVAIIALIAGSVLKILGVL